VLVVFFFLFALAGGFFDLAVFFEAGFFLLGERTTAFFALTVFDARFFFAMLFDAKSASRTLRFEDRIDPLKPYHTQHIGESSPELGSKRPNRVNHRMIRYIERSRVPRQEIAPGPVSVGGASRVG
jgi:hypothetical protein